MTAKKDTTAAVATLRALALSRGQKLRPLHLILDDQLRDEQRTFAQHVDVLRMRQLSVLQGIDVDDYTEPDQPTSLGDPTPVEKRETTLDRVKRLLDQAEQAAADVEADAAKAGVVLVLNFRRLAPAQYQKVADDAEQAVRTADEQDPMKSTIDQITDRIRDALPALCYVGAATPAGDDLGLTLDDLLANTLDHADWETVKEHCLTICREGQAVDFHRASSGTSGQS